MPKRAAAILYFLTAVATFGAGLDSFGSMHALTSTINARWLASFAIIDFAAPTIFLLASISAASISEKSTASPWMTATTISIGLILVVVHYGLGWRQFAEVTAVLLSAVFILSSPVRQASTTAGVGTAFYTVFQGEALIINLQNYWTFGGSARHLLGTIIPPILVVSSLVVALTSHIKTRASIARAHLDV
jgi:hypothetical protein